MPNENRKERVLHTRIPATLEDQIKKLAEAWRVPVSNLVRNMLEDAIAMTRRVRDRMPESMGGTPAVATDLTDVYGWQELTLNVTAPCARCSTTLTAGDEAYVGLTDRPRDSKVFLCPACLPRRAGYDNKSSGKE